MKHLHWKKNATPEALHALLNALAEAYPVNSENDRADIEISFERSEKPDVLKIVRQGNWANIFYGQANHAARAVGALLAGIPEPGGTLTESSPFTTFGIMLDCSRNAVMKVETVKKWLRKLALFGYNMAMLYTEDTYELPGEDCFGFLRGRYTAAELKEIDGYASRLGIEMIGCIQTLGHLRRMLKWPCYASIRDTDDILLVGEEKTHELIGKMLDQFANCFASRRIHVGMDETNNLGRGRYLDIHGYENNFDIFKTHLAKVVALCRDRGLKPMMWSDMFFKLGGQGGGYYDRDWVAPKSVASGMPADLQWVYWEYNKESETQYREAIRRHRLLGGEPVMASGIRTWKRLWYHHDKTRHAVDPCIRACRKEKLKAIFFTLWGDQGAYCEFDSAFAGLCYAAERSFNAGELDPHVLEKRFQAVCGYSYSNTLLPDEPLNDNFSTFSAPQLLWDDPLIGKCWSEMAAQENGAAMLREKQSDLETLIAKLEPLVHDRAAPDMEHARNLAITLKDNLDIQHKLKQAYAQGDEDKLREVSNDVDAVIEGIERLTQSFRRQWYKRNKPQGFEGVHLRMAGLSARYRELQQRIGELLKNECENIPELEEILKRNDAS